MRKVFLIDDEPWALQSLEAALPWREFGFHISGRYTNALEAMDAIAHEPPDVAFIDIRMPDLTGLEIAQRSQSDTIFVIVSGYEEFEYAQKAMRLGIFDYCLKPVEESTGRDLLKRISDKLAQESQMRYALLCEQILGRGDIDFIFDNFRPTGDYWQAAILRLVSTEAEAEACQRVLDIKHLHMRMGIAKHMFIFNGHRDSLEAKVKEALSPLSGLGTYIGVSRAEPAKDGLIQMINQAHSSSLSDFIRSEPRFVTYDGNESPCLEASATAFAQAIDVCSTDGFAAALAELREIAVKGKDVQVWHLIRFWNHVMDAFRQKAAFSRGAKGAPFAESLLRITEPIDLHHYLWDFENMCKSLAAVMEEFVHVYHGIQVERQVNDSFLALLDYVNNNYCQRGLRLTDLAIKFHMNLTHCSELFRKVTGATYTEYLTMLRMKHAEGSIRKGDTNLQQLAYELGYGDYFTFSKRFKQYHGISPSQMK